MLSDGRGSNEDNRVTFAWPESQRKEKQRKKVLYYKKDERERAGVKEIHPAIWSSKGTVCSVGNQLKKKIGCVVGLSFSTKLFHRSTRTGLEGFQVLRWRYLSLTPLPILGSPNLRWCLQD